MAFKISLTEVTSSMLKANHHQAKCLHIVNLPLQNSLLDIAKENLNRVKPRAILCVEQDIDFQFLTHLQDLSAVMEPSVIHEKDYSLITSIGVSSDMTKHLENNLFKLS
jgi:hypothetical protein